jgi:autotransporter translocation and assembly factor TamB
MEKNKKQRRYFFTYFLILLLGSTGVFLTKTDVGFNIVYRILKQQINSRYNYQLSIKDLSTPLKTNLQADQLEFANKDSSLIINIDTVNIDYKGIFELLGRRHLDSLKLIEPHIYVKLGDKDSRDNKLSDIKFPNFLINNIRIVNADLTIDMPDTLITQTIDHMQFHYSGKNDMASLVINDLKLKNKALGIDVKGLQSDVVIKNNIAKLRNLTFVFNDSQIRSSGKIRYMEPLRFQFNFNIKDFSAEDYLDLPIIKENDVFDLDLDIMGDFNAFTATVDIDGILNGQKIDQSSFNIEYKDDYLHLLQANFKNKGTDISIYGSYGLKDKYLSTTLTSHQLTPSDWLTSLPDFGFEGRLRAAGYLDKRLKVNYNFNCNEIYGIETANLSGDVTFNGLNSIVLDSTNQILLKDGLLKARGNIRDLKTVDLDIFGNVASLNELDIPNMGDIKADDIYLTLRVLGDITDPDIQMNLNLDTLKYDAYTVNNLNASLFSNKTISQPGGAVLVSFENAAIDSFMIGSVQTYVRVEEDSIFLDYLDITHENYNMSLSAKVGDLKEFTVETMQGQYLGEDVYLLDPVTFSIKDNGFDLSRFDVLYRDALLSGMLNVKDDILKGNLNIAGAELSSLPLVSTMFDSINGLLDMNVGITGKLGDPVIFSDLSLKDGHAFGLSAQMIRSEIHYVDNMLFIDDLKFDINNDRRMSLVGQLPLNINFKKKKKITLLPKDPLYADVNIENARLQKLLPFILKNLHIVGNADAVGTITGTINDPVIDADLFIRDPKVEKIVGDSVKGVFHYGQQRLYFNDVEIFSGEGYYKGEANLFTDLRFQTNTPRFDPDSSLYVYVSGTDNKMIYLTPFIKQIESLTGDLYTELEITGSFNESSKNGKVTMKNGRLVLDILGNEIENVDAEATLVDNDMSVKLNGKLPSDAYTLASALGLENDNVDDRYNFEVTGNMDMSFMIRPDFNLRLTGGQMGIVTLDEKVNLTTESANLFITGQDTLNVDGDVTIQEGLIEFGLNRMPPQTSTIIAPEGDWIKTAYSINTTIDKLYFRNQFIDATLNGDMILQKYPSEQRTRMGGELDVTDGFFNYWASMFVLQEGSLVLDQFEGNHELNFKATKNVVVDNETVEITANITGELNDPEITFTDEYNELSQAAIIQALTLGEIRGVVDDVRNISEGSTGINFGSAANALLSLAEVPLEQQARKLAGVGGLDRIDIKSNTQGAYIDGTTAYGLVVGGRIGRNFYLTYEGSQDKQVNIEYEYRLNNKVSIVGSAGTDEVGAAVRLRLQY